MRRREFVASIGAAIAGSLSALAQRGSKQHRIALVHSGIPAADLTESAGPFWVRRFLQELRRLGYVEGGNVVVQRYSAEGHQERFAALAREVVTSEPDLIVMNYSVLARAFQAATSTIPLLGIVADPVRTGLVTSLARPGGNFTGVSVDAGVGLFGKRLQLLKELLPSIQRVAYLGTPVEWNGLNVQELRAAGGHLELTVFGVLSEQIADPHELRRLFHEAVRERADAAVVSAGGFVLAHRQLIVELAAANGLPAMYAFREFIEAGGLAAYGPDLGEAAEHLASQVDQVLKGAKPSDLPVHQASKFALVINITTARALDLSIPPTLLARADEVIE
jgi:putative tryptophan/tyrosine transport system substrate-binding protein